MPYKDTQFTALIAILAHPSANSPQTLLSNVGYYLPILKTPAEITQLTTSVLNLPLFTSFDDLYAILDLFASAFARKVVISVPTVSLMSFYNAVLTAVLDHKDIFSTLLRQNLILLGVMAIREKLYSYAPPEDHIFYTKFDKVALSLIVENFRRIEASQGISYESRALNLLCLSTIHHILKSDEIHSSYGRKLIQILPLTHIPDFALPLLYKSSYGFGTAETLRIHSLINNNVQNTLHNLLKKPVLRHFSRLSFLIQTCLVDVVTAKRALQNMLEFSSHLHQVCCANSSQYSDQLGHIELYWDLLKQIVFSSVIIFQAVIDMLLSEPYLSECTTFFPGNKANRAHTRLIFHNLSIDCLKVMFHYHFIVERIGKGGFRAYNEAYMTCIELLLETSTPGQSMSGEQLSDLFISQISFQSMKMQIERSKFLFLLGYWEALVMVCSPQYYDDVINPVTTEYIRRPYLSVDFEQVSKTRAIFENCHSVKLKSFKLKRLAVYNTKYVLQYLDLVLHQFPLVLSSHQLILATSELASLVHNGGIIGELDGSIQEVFLSKIYQKIVYEGIGHRIETFEESDEETPPSTKAAFIYGFLRTVPYIEKSHFLGWLDRINSQIRNGGLLQDERRYCEAKLWEVISTDLGIERLDEAIRWWYARAEKL